MANLRPGTLATTPSGRIQSANMICLYVGEDVQAHETRKVWRAAVTGPLAWSYQTLLHTTDVATPWLSGADPEEVRREIEQRNPDAYVVLDTDWQDWDRVRRIR